MNRIALLLLVACSSPRPQPASPTPPPAPAPPAPVAPAPAAAKSAYPDAPPGPVVDTLHGVRVPDPYRWLEDIDSAQTRAWVAKENTLTDAYLQAIPGRDALRARLAELAKHETFGPPIHRGGRYIWIYRDDHSDQPFIEMQTSLTGPATTLLDVNQISTDGSKALAGMNVSRDGKLLAYGLSEGGGDWHTWHVRDVATGKDLPDVLPDIKYYGPAFDKDGKGLYYSRFPAPAPGKELTETDHDCKVYYHRLGTPVAEDKVVFAKPDHPTWQYDPAVTRDGNYLVITIGDGEVGDRGVEQVAVLDLTKPGSAPIALVDNWDAEYELAGTSGSTLFFKTTAKAPNKRVVATDLRKPAWREIVPEGKLAIESASVVGGQLFITALQDAHTAVTAYDLHGKKLRDVELPGLGTAFGFGGEPTAKETFFYFTGFTTPGAVYRYELASGRVTPWKQPKVAFDPDAFETKQIFFPSKDGTKVPMFVTAKKNLVLDGSHPTIMTAYGFGGISSLPYFSSSDIAWLERGGISVLVNIRGGGEYGEAWHHAAWRDHRQTGLDDFASAGEYLIANHYTSAAHLGTIGASGGGFLVAAVALQHPDEFAATIPLAGVHDLLRFQLFGQGAGWQGDFGSPDDPHDFAFLRTISPLHNVRPGTHYPAMLIVTADHDVRVAPLHSYKLAAALQAAQAGPNPILLRVETKSGHGGGSTLSQKIEQQTETMAFFAANLGLKL